MPDGATQSQNYSVYLLQCGDGSLYTGIATDVARRIAEHKSSTRGAKYLRGRGPLTLVFQQHIGNRSLASKVEAGIKRLPKEEKANTALLPKKVQALIAQHE